MNPDDPKERIELFLSLADALPSARQTIDNIYRLVSKYDVPKHVDRNFIYECLIAFYSRLEEYEKCAELFKIQQDISRKKRLTVKGMTRADLLDLRMLGFQIPDSVRLKVLYKSRKNKND